MHPVELRLDIALAIAVTGPSRDRQLANVGFLTREPQGDEVSDSGLDGRSQLLAGQQPAASNIGGEDIIASSEERDDSNQQESPQGQ